MSTYVALLALIVEAMTARAEAVPCRSRCHGLAVFRAWTLGQALPWHAAMRRRDLHVVFDRSVRLEPQELHTAWASAASRWLHTTSVP